jgi:N-acetylneuraminic acid mutarotase
MACFELAVTYAPFGVAGLVGVYFNNRIIIIGGFDGTFYHGFIVQSQNGRDWNVVAQNASGILPARAYHAAAILDNRIFISGGTNGTAMGDVWMSNDGERFTQIAVNAFPARYQHAMFAFDNRLWVVGGHTGAANLSDCWCSYNGIMWTRVVNGYSIISRRNMGYCVYDNRMWIAGGINAAGTVLNSVYHSTDGKLWTLGQTPADFPAVCGCSLTSFNNKMVLIGGATDAQRGTVSNQLWYSFHGQDWILGCPNTGLNVMEHAAVAVTEQQRLYVGGGYDGAAYSGNVWRTVGEEFLTKAW